MPPAAFPTLVDAGKFAVGDAIDVGDPGDGEALVVLITIEDVGEDGSSGPKSGGVCPTNIV